jgi:hypothetical protein
VLLVLSSVPDKSWGANPREAPPSYAAFASPAVGFTEPSGTVDAPRGTSTAVTLGAQSDSVGATTLDWRISSSNGVSVAPSSGQLELAAESSDEAYARRSTMLHLTATSARIHQVHVTFSDPRHDGRVPSVTLEVKP